MDIPRETVEYTTIDTFGDDFDLDARPEQSTSDTIQSGWEAAESLTPAFADFPSEFKNSETSQVIKFLDLKGPFASYKLHFLQQKLQGRRSYVCIGVTCPLCTILDHKPEDKRAFTIANLSMNPFLKQQLISTPRLYKTIHAAESSPQGPLNKNYWALSRTGIKQTTVYHLNSIKGRDLGEDWGIDEKAAEKAIAEMTPYLSSVIRRDSYEDLLTLAQELV